MGDLKAIQACMTYNFIPWNKYFIHFGKYSVIFGKLTAAAIFGKLAIKRQFFYMSEHEITRSLAPRKGTQSTSYLVDGSQRIN